MARGIIISDTHYGSLEKLNQHLVAEVKCADFVIHAGDADTTNFISELQAISPKKFYAVAGNCDYGSVLPTQLVVDICGLTVGISHGAGNHHNIIDRLSYSFSDSNVDIIVFGHTHRPFHETISGITFFNPGSVSSNRGIDYNSYGVLSVDSKDNFKLSIERLPR